MINQFSNCKSPNNINIISLDIGEKRIGIAYSEGGTFAFPLKTVTPETLGREIESLGKIDKIIVGLPRNMDGTLGIQTKKVKEFMASHLKKYRGLVEYIDETATSLAAEELMKNEGKDAAKNPELIDAYAAKIILDDYICERKNEFL